METIKGSLFESKNVYLRGFSSFLIKRQAKKTARNNTKNTTIIISVHYNPLVKPAKEFLVKVN